MKPLSRLFIGLQLDCPWPQQLPHGRVLKEEDRHITLSFLGQQEEEKVKEALQRAPSYEKPLAPCGVFDGCLFLPEHSPNVVSWHASFEGSQDAVSSYQAKLEEFLHQEEILKDLSKKPWLPHATICRKPFNVNEWKEAFQMLPFVVQSSALYKSLGNSEYELLFEKKWLLPFEKLSHTADLAYIVRGENFPTLFKHAKLALAFTHPPFIAYTPPEVDAFKSIEEVIAMLNRLITDEDTIVGCPMKAVSYHTEQKNLGDLLEWEMIIDV